MLDDVERRTRLIEPAREDPAPAVVGPLYIDLDEGAGILEILPRRSLLAGAQADDDIADTRRFAGLQLDLARHAVALVEQAERRDAVLHRRRAGIDCAALHRDGRYLRRGLVGRIGGDDVVDTLVVTGFASGTARAKGQQQGRRNRRTCESGHAPGVQAS